MSKEEFVTRYVYSCFKDGQSFDEYDIEMSWQAYKTNPNDFIYLEDVEYED